MFVISKEEEEEEGKASCLYFIYPLNERICSVQEFITLVHQPLYP